MRALVRVMMAMPMAVMATVSALGQDYRTLEGMTVTARLDMPASQEGVDLRPAMEFPLDLHKAADRIKQYGVGVHTGQSIMITKVVVKTHNIEVQLGGGGYGTFNDAMAQAASTPTVSYVGETRREKDLKEQLKYTNDYWERERMRRELDDIERQRNRDNQRAAQIDAQTQMTQVSEQQKRAQSGSRFNIRYDGTMPADAATKKGIMEALSRYVDFEASLGSGQQHQWIPMLAQQNAPELISGTALRKGLTVVQVEQILGPAAKVSEMTEGTLESTVREYDSDGQRVTAQFVGGVLVNYKITSQ